MKLFSYPSRRYTRRLAPGPFASYRTYKPFLRNEFRARCVYCMMLDTLASPRANTFCVDHYLAKRYYPHLETAYANLFYSCSDCNLQKWAWPYDRKGLKVGFTIPNPCEHVMAEHLEFQADGSVAAKTRDGEATIDLLNINDPRSVGFRGTWITIRRIYYLQIKELRGKKREAERLLMAGQLPAIKVESLKKLLAKLDVQRRDLRTAMVRRLLSPQFEV